MLFDRGCLGALHRKKIKPGMPVRFQASCLWDTRAVVRVLSLGEP